MDAVQIDNANISKRMRLKEETVSASLTSRHVEGFRVNILQEKLQDWMCMAIRLGDDSLLLIALDAEFCLNARTQINGLVAKGAFDPVGRIGAEAASQAATAFIEVRARIPDTVFHQDLSEAVAVERGMNLCEEGVLELDFILKSGADGMIWFDDTGVQAFALAVSDCERHGLQGRQEPP